MSRPRLLLAGAAALLAAAPAQADVGADAVRPTIGKPGQSAVLSSHCGSCRPGLRLPISLVPVARVPSYHLCVHRQGGQPRGFRRQRISFCQTPWHVPAPPRKPPFASLGTAIVRPEIKWPAQAPLGFAIPRLAPGVYAFAIYLDDPDRRGGRLLAHAERAEELLVIARPGDRLDRARRAALRRPARAWVRRRMAELKRLTRQVHRLDDQCRRQRRLRCDRLLPR